MKKYVYIFLVPIYFLSCKKECRPKQELYYLPSDSVYTTYTGFDTLKFQISDSNNVVIDTAIFYGTGKKKYWGEGPVRWLCNPVTDGSENEDYNYYNSKDTNIRMIISFDAHRAEYVTIPEARILCGEYKPNTFFINKYFIKCSKFYERIKDSVNVLGVNYGSVLEILADDIHSYPFSRAAFYNKKSGFIKMIGEDYRVWRKIP
jgi:hypothetical protein